MKGLSPLSSQVDSSRAIRQILSTYYVLNTVDNTRSPPLWNFIPALRGVCVQTVNSNQRKLGNYPGCQKLVSTMGGGGGGK